MALRDDLVARIKQTPGMGKVYPYQRFAKQNHDFRTFYLDDKVLAGGYVHRIGAHTTGHEIRFEQWQLVLFQALDDDKQSEVQIDERIDALMDDFNANAQVGIWRAVEQNGKTGWQLIKSQPAMVTGVLCHHATLRLQLVK